MKSRWFFPVLLALPMILLTACGGSTASGGTQDVQVTLSEYQIASPLTTFSKGVPYHFVVKNTGKIAHEFMIMPMGQMPGEDMHHMALAHLENIAPGETKTVDFTFAQDTSGQNLEFACHLVGHYEAGMKQSIKVNT